MNLNRTISVLLFSSCIILSSCTSPDNVIRPRPEGIFYKSSTKKIKSAVANACINRQLFIENQSDNVVLCSRDANSIDQVLFGTRYGSGVTTKMQFNIVNLPDKATKVVGRGWLENQNAFGGTKKHFIDNGNLPNEIRSMIIEAKTALGE